MSNKETKLLKSSFGTALATLASRILGLIRMRLEAQALGGGLTATIWFFAMIFPNIFRRLLGEGALGTALIPLITETEKISGVSEARRHLAQILTFAGALLALIVCVVSAGALLCGEAAALYDWGFLQSEKVQGGCQIIPLLMPYAFFICLTGIISGVLNYSGLFVRPALTAVFFNLVQIAGLLAGIFLDLPSSQLLKLLAVQVPVAGAVQFGLMLWMLKICGRFPIFSKNMFRDLSPVKNLWKLAAPSFIGYGVLQLSFLVDRTLALFLNNRAVPALTYVDRIVDLPIGLFAVSLGTVLMTSMTRAVVDKDFDAMREQLNFSLRHVWFICAPMAVSVIFFHTEMLRVLCLGGKYTLDDLNATRLVAIFYGIGIPFFCSLKVILPAFYSRKDMKRPLYVSIAAISVNIVLNLILMFPLQQGGLALATVIASITNNSILLFLLKKEGLSLRYQTIISAAKSTIFSLVSASVVYFFLPYLRQMFHFQTVIVNDIFILIAAGIAFGTGYLVLSVTGSSVELREFLSILRRKKTR